MQYALDDLLPHRAPMLFIDAVDAERNLAFFTPKSTQLLALEPGLPAWVGVEIMAQAIAALTQLAQRQAGSSDRLRSGMLLQVKGFSCEQPYFEFDQPLCIGVEQLASQASMHIYHCQLALAAAPNECLAEARLTITEETL